MIQFCVMVLMALMCCSWLVSPMTRVQQFWHQWTSIFTIFSMLKAPLGCFKNLCYIKADNKEKALEDTFSEYCGYWCVWNIDVRIVEPTSARCVTRRHPPCVLTPHLPSHSPSHPLQYQPEIWNMKSSIPTKQISIFDFNHCTIIQQSLKTAVR